MVRTIIHGARMEGGGGLQMGFSIPVSNFHLIAEGGGGDSPGTGPCPTFFLIFKKSVKRTEKNSATWSVIIIVPGFANLTIHKMPTDSDVLWVSLAYKAPHRTCGRKRKLPTHTAVYGKLKVCCDPNLPKVKSY